MGLASLGLDTGVLCDFIYSVLLLNAIFGLDFLLGAPCISAAGEPTRSELSSTSFCFDATGCPGDLSLRATLPFYTFSTTIQPPYMLLKMGHPLQSQTTTG